MAIDDSRGFSLIETIVAVGLLAGAITGFVSLFVLNTRANLSSRHVSVATTLAGAKLEELRRAPPLAASPANALAVSAAGFCDLLNEQGARLAACIAPGDRAPYIRRWAVEPQAGPIPATVLRVLVTWNPDAAASNWGGRHVDEVRLATLKVEGWR